MLRIVIHPTPKIDTSVAMMFDDKEPGKHVVVSGKHPQPFLHIRPEKRLRVL